MLEIKLEQAMAPDQMEETPCGMCGVEFQPGAVLVSVEVDGDWLHESLLCHDCLRHLARRAETEEIPADWDNAYRRYLVAEEKYPEPVFASMEVLLEYERQHGGYPDYSEMEKV